MRASACWINRSRRSVFKIFLLAIVGAVCVPCGGVFAKDKPLSWKAIQDALLRVNDEPVKDWGVYQTGKKNDPLLLHMGARFLLLDLREQQMFEINPSKIEHKSAELLWNPSDRPAKPLATSEWMERDVGAAYRVSAKIDGENSVLDLQLPHPPDIGDLPSRSSRPAGRRR